MKTTLEETKPEAKTLIDTSRMNAGQRAALEMAEAARMNAATPESPPVSFLASRILASCCRFRNKASKITTREMLSCIGLSESLISMLIPMRSTPLARFPRCC